MQGFSPIRTREREEGTNPLPSQQNLKLLIETTGATNGHFLVHNGKNCECSMLKYICEVPLCVVLVRKWEIIVPALIYVGTVSLFHFPLPNSYGSSMDLQ